jgi:hypothetical protein
MTEAEPMNFDTNFLFANLFWGTVGSGYCLYGWKQKMLTPFLGGLAMIAVSYFVGSALLMSLICIALMVAVYLLVKRG